MLVEIRIKCNGSNLYDPGDNHSIPGGSSARPALGLVAAWGQPADDGPMAKRAKQTEAKAAAKSKMPGAAMLDKYSGSGSRAPISAPNSSPG